MSKSEDPSIPKASSDTQSISSEQVRAARALLRWEQKDLASTSLVSLPTIKRLETKPGVLQANATTIRAIRQACEAAGVEFIPENGGGPGVRLKQRNSEKG